MTSLFLVSVTPESDYRDAEVPFVADVDLALSMVVCPDEVCGEAAFLPVDFV